MYRGQTAQIRLDRKSREFEIQRGTKQGDPLSSCLFNALLEDIIQELQNSWRKKKWGLQIGETEASILTNLRFADDVLIIGKSLHQVTKMLGQVANKAAKSGLQLHPDKTKIMSNTTRRTGQGKDKMVQVEHMNIEILPIEGSLKYLGRQICFDKPHEIEGG